MIAEIDSLLGRYWVVGLIANNNIDSTDFKFFDTY
jgi:hypothetical protein